MKFKVWQSKRVFSGHIFDVFCDWLEIEGKQKIYREVLRNHKEVSAIVPVESDHRVVLVKQFRYPVKKEILEIPAGLVEKGESPLACAKRELLEETGYRAKSFLKIATFYTTPGYSDELLHLFLATGLSKVELNIDKEEVSEVIKLSLSEAVDLFLKGKIVDAKTGLGLVLIYLLKEKADFDELGKRSS